MLSVGTPTELTFELHKANSILQEPNNLFILETHISSSTVFAQQSPKPSGQEFALTISPFLDYCCQNRHRQIIERICVTMEKTELKVNGILPLDVCTEMISFEI